MLTKDEFDNLRIENKEFSDGRKLCISSEHCKVQRELKSVFTDNKFILTIERGRIDFLKIKYQTRRSQTNEVLLRIDTKGPRHINPDGEIIECPHIHIYREGWGDKWAQPLNPEIFKDTSDLVILLKDFLNYFGVINIPCIEMEGFQEKFDV